MRWRGEPPLPGRIADQLAQPVGRETEGKQRREPEEGRTRLRRAAELPHRTDESQAGDQRGGDGIERLARQAPSVRPLRGEDASAVVLDRKPDVEPAEVGVRRAGAGLDHQPPALGPKLHVQYRLRFQAVGHP